MAIGRALIERGCNVALMVSAKAVDQLATRGVSDFEIVTVPAEQLSRTAPLNFVRGASRSFTLARALFKERNPAAVLGMGSFTSVGPMLAAKSLGIRTFLHEANALPGKANRYLAPLVDKVFLGFHDSKGALRQTNVEVTGTPVREEIAAGDPSASRMALGLHPQRPTILIMGGSQGATALNQLIVKALPDLLTRWPDLQFIHLSGASDFASVQAAYKAAGAKGLVAPFLTEINYALNAATVAIARSGASTLAEFATVRLPALFIPLPTAADDHQTLNAHALVKTGAALLLQQREATPERLVQKLSGLLDSPETRAFTQHELGKWQFPNPAQVVADRILESIGWEAPDYEAELLRSYQAKLNPPTRTSVLEPQSEFANA